jgi:hypothetical protein
MSTVNQISCAAIAGFCWKTISRGWQEHNAKYVKVGLQLEAEGLRGLSPSLSAAEYKKKNNAEKQPLFTIFPDIDINTT